MEKMMARMTCNSTMTDPTTDWCVKSFELNHMIVCYEKSLTKANGLWRARNAADYSVPTFLLQLIMIATLNRFLIAIFRYLRLPRMAAEILGGVILGGAGLGFTDFGRKYLYPFRSIYPLETIANLGLLYYMFLVGLEVDIKPVIQAPQKAFSIAIAGLTIPFVVGYALHHLLVKNLESVSNSFPTRLGPLFWGVAFSTTNFTELAQVLSDLKLLRSEVGRTALSAAMITDSVSWVLFVVSIAMVNEEKVYTIAFASAFVLFALLVVQPAFALAAKLTRQLFEKFGGYNDDHISYFLVLIVACGYITDRCGCHSILGGFIFGLTIPNGDLKEKLIQKIEDFVPGFMIPLFFSVVGMRTTIDFVFGKYSIGSIVAVLIVGALVKIASTFVVAFYVNKLNVRDALALGALMNTKGMLSLIIVSSAKDFKVLNNVTFTMIILSIWLITITMEPLLILIYKATKLFGCDIHDDDDNNTRKQLSVASLDPDSELRVLTCFHSTRELSSIANLLETFNPTHNSPLSVSSVHLVENVGRTSAMRIVHDTCKTDADADYLLELSSSLNTLKSGKEPGVLAVEMLTAVSAYATMHVDVCSLAREKRASLVVLPLTKAKAPPNPLRQVNKSVIDHADCSVAVLVERGVWKESQTTELRHEKLLVIFIGGDDDREAIALVGRMLNYPGLALTIVRFIRTYKDSTEKMLDDRCIDELRQKLNGDGNNNKLVEVMETTMNCGDEIVKTVMAMESGKYDLVVVGRGGNRKEPLLATESAEWTEFPELGFLGDTLVCSNFAANAGILVVQQGGER